MLFSKNVLATTQLRLQDILVVLLGQIAQVHWSCGSRLR